MCSRRRLGLVTFVLFALVAAAQLAASCVDGVTPDCGLPDAQCNPTVDGGSDGAQAAAPDGANAGANDGAASIDASDAADAGAVCDAADGG